MKYPIVILTLLLLSSLSIDAQLPSQTPQDDSDKPLYFATGSEAAVVGTITVTGTVPKAKRIDTSADPVCTELDPKLETDDFVVNENRLQNAFVYVKGDLLNVYRFAVPGSEVTLEHKHCTYSPHVLGMQAGQRLSVVNSDPTFHNVHPTPKMNPEWNQSQAAGAPPLAKTFPRPEVLVPVKCNQHPWERAYVGVLKHPYFSVSDASGKFEIYNLPPGTYELIVWHEHLGEQKIELTLAPGETRKTDFTFDIKTRP
jgi:plastocyanin